MTFKHIGRKIFIYFCQIKKIMALFITNWRILVWLSYTTFLIRPQFCWFFGRFEDSKRTFRNKSTFLSNRINLKSRTLRMNQGCISLKLLNYKKSTKMNVLPTNLMKSWKKCTNRRSKSFKKEKKILKDFKKCPFL